MNCRAALRIVGQDRIVGQSQVHANLAKVLRAHLPLRCAPDAFVFTSAEGHPIIEDNFYRRHWLAILRLLNIRPRAFYQTRHTYISHMIEEVGARPLYVARQTGTSLAMIDEHYGRARITAADVDRRIDEAQNRNLTGTFVLEGAAAPSRQAKKPQRLRGVK